MGEPVRVQRRRTRGWKAPEGAVYVGRGSVWGNPYRVVVSGRFRDTGEPAWSGRHDWEINYPMHRTKEEAAERAVQKFEEHIAAGLLKADLSALRGKTLMCWCPEGQPCHADVLLRLANGTQADAQAQGEG